MEALNLEWIIIERVKNFVALEKQARVLKLDI